MLTLIIHLLLTVDVSPSWKASLLQLGLESTYTRSMLGMRNQVLEKSAELEANRKHDRQRQSQQQQQIFLKVAITHCALQYSFRR